MPTAKWRAQDQVIAVTGASKGIGLATAKALLARGARVALTGRDSRRLEQAVVGLDPERVMIISVDGSDRDGMNRAMASVQDRWQRLDGIVNNVGRQFVRRIEHMPPAEVEMLIRANLMSTIFGCQAAIPLLRANGGGRIVNISSSAVRDDNEFSHIGVYTACKAAVDQFSHELRKEVMSDGILVTLFSSGGVETGGSTGFDPNALQDAYQTWLDNGRYFGGITTPDVMGEAIANCFEYPPGIAAEFVEVKSNQRMHKVLEDPSRL